MFCSHAKGSSEMEGCKSKYRCIKVEHVQSNFMFLMYEFILYFLCITLHHLLCLFQVAYNSKAIKHTQKQWTVTL